MQEIIFCLKTKTKQKKLEADSFTFKTLLKIISLKVLAKNNLTFCENLSTCSCFVKPVFGFKHFQSTYCN